MPPPFLAAVSFVLSEVLLQLLKWGTATGQQVQCWRSAGAGSKRETANTGSGSKSWGFLLTYNFTLVPHSAVFTARTTERKKIEFLAGTGEEILEDTTPGLERNVGLGLETLLPNPKARAAIADPQRQRSAPQDSEDCPGSGDRTLLA